MRTVSSPARNAERAWRPRGERETEAAPAPEAQEVFAAADMVG